VCRLWGVGFSLGFSLGFKGFAWRSSVSRATNTRASGMRYLLHMLYALFTAQALPGGQVFRVPLVRVLVVCVIYYTCCMRYLLHMLCLEVKCFACH
jgi:hypothetical protein